MKYISFNRWLKFSISIVAFGTWLAAAEDITEVQNPPPGGSFWLLSAELNHRPFPPFPFDPYNGALPIYEINGFPRQYVVGDSPEDFQQLNAVKKSRSFGMNSLEDDGPPAPPGSGGEEVEVTYGPSWFTNASETLLFDTMSSSSNGVLASWRDVRSSPVPDGMALGIVIQTNYPFQITRVEAEVVLTDSGSLSTTDFEVGFFRGTNQFSLGMYVEPECIFSEFEETISKTLTNLGNGRWLLNIEITPYAWGTNRVFTIRTVPASDGTMTKLSLVSCSNTIPGFTAYASDNTTTNMVQVALPKMRIWRQMISSIRSPSYEATPFTTDFELSWLPGYQLGATADLLTPMNWQTDDERNRSATIDTRDGSGFFLTRPDPTR